MKRLLAVVSVFLLLAPTALGATWTNATWSADAENVILAKLHATEQQYCGFTRTETSQLETLARFKTADMVYRAYASHTAPDGWGTDDGMRNAGISTGGAMAEDLGWNSYPDDTSAAHIWEAWKASPGHWSAIVNCAYRQLGVGAMKDGTNHLYAIEFVKGVAPSPTPTPTSTPTAAPSATPKPTAAPTATPAPSSTPAPTVATCTRTFSGDATGTTDVTAALATFLNGGSGAASCLKPGGTYRISGQLHLQGVTNATVDGQGATIRQTTRATNEILLVDYGSTAVTLRNLTIVGANPSPGLWNLTYEHNHGIRLGGVRNSELANVTIRNVGGDGVYLAGAYQPGGAFRFDDTIRVRDSTIDGNGRMGVAITDGANNLTLDHNTFARIAYYTLDFEANGHVFAGVAAGSINTRFTDNTLGPQPYSAGGAGQPTGHAFVVTGTSGGGPAEGITVSRNTISGRSFDVGVYNNGGSRKAITVSDNRSDTRVAGPAMTFAGVAGLTVTGNVQPLSSGSLVSTSGCTSVVISGNVTS
jgi:hypothetical protein